MATGNTTFSDVSIIHIPLSGSCMPLQISLACGTKPIPPLCIVMLEKENTPRTQPETQSSFLHANATYKNKRGPGTGADLVDLQYITPYHLFVDHPKRPTKKNMNVCGRLMLDCSFQRYTVVQTSIWRGQVPDAARDSLTEDEIEFGVPTVTGPHWTFRSNAARGCLELAHRNSHPIRITFVGVASHRDIHACSVWSIVHLLAPPNQKENTGRHPRIDGGVVVNCPLRVKWIGKYFDVIFGARTGLSFHVVVIGVLLGRVNHQHSVSVSV